jgi:hypothetical protein
LLQVFFGGGSGSFVVTWLAADVHAMIVTDFARAMNTMVVAHFSGAVYAVVITWLVMGATASGGG